MAVDAWRNNALHFVLGDLLFNFENDYRLESKMSASQIQKVVCKEILLPGEFKDPTSQLPVKPQRKLI